MSYLLEDFITESNRIEGIHHEPTSIEIVAHLRLLDVTRMEVADLEAFVSDVAGVPLRRKAGMDVRIGSHRPPPGGPTIEPSLRRLLDSINLGLLTPYQAHTIYETIHPFIDGNGRSGRALWLWHMLRAGRDPWALSFLHRWYYDSLAGRRAPEEDASTWT